MRARSNAAVASNSVGWLAFGAAAGKGAAGDGAAGDGAAAGNGAAGDGAAGDPAGCAETTGLAHSEPATSRQEMR